MAYKMWLIRIAVLITVSWVGNTVGNLTTFPKNTVAKFGDRVELECSSSSADAQIPVRWEFSRAGSHTNMFIYHSGIITHSLQNKYAIDNKAKGRYNLIMNSVDLSFGGSYTCIDADEESTRSSRYAELIVIVSSPVCSTNSSAVVVEGDYIQIVCTVNYTGNWLPVMECSKSSGQNIEINSARNSTPWTSSLITQLTLNDNEVIFTCNTAFKLMPTNNRTADEIVQAINNNYTWNFTVYVSNATTDRGKPTRATYVPAVTDNGAKPLPTGLTTAKLAVIIGTSASVLILCLSIAIVIYKICRKGNAKPDIVPEAKQNSSEISDRPQADLVPPPMYAEVQRHSNGFLFVEAHPSPFYASVKKQTMVGDMNKPTVTNSCQQNQNFPVYAEVKKIEKEKKMPGPSGQTPLLNETRPKQNYAGADGTQYMELDSLTELKSNGVTTKRPPMFNLVETYATIDHTLVVPPPPPPSLPRRHQH